MSSRVNEFATGHHRSAFVFVMGGAPHMGFPHSFIPMCEHPEHEERWVGKSERGDSEESPGYHAAWDAAKAHDIVEHGSSDNAGSPDYSQEDPFSPRRVKR